MEIQTSIVENSLENGLELVVSEQTLGKLVTNAVQIRDMVKSMLPRYGIANYTDENIDQAKRDKADLNKASKALNAKRIELEKEFMKPFAEFKEVVGETVALIGECSAKIDLVVKQNEQQYKDRKKAQIEAYFNAKNAGGAVAFGKVFNPSWLNKTESMKLVCAEIDNTLARIREDIASLRDFGEDFDALRVYYLDTLNLASTLNYACRLEEQRGRARKAEEARAKAEEERLQAEEERLLEEASIQIEGRMEETPAAPEDTVEEELLTRAFRVTATREDIIALGDFMNDRGIDFERIYI